MAGWLWALIAVAVALAILGLVYVASRRSSRQVEQRRAEAATLRERARIREEKAERREELAREQADEARREREAAHATATRADEVDPDAD